VPLLLRNPANWARFKRTSQA